jgi:hypothetical protein
MKNSTAQSSRKSREKEARNAKTFRIPISNGIFEHYERLKDSRWLLDLYVDWTTKEVRTPDGSFDGIVLGGKPIRDEDAAVPFGCCARTTRRWRQRLASFGYIDQLRTPMGYVIRVKKSKKWPERPDKNVQSDRTKMSVHSESELPDVSGQKYQVCPIRTTDHVRSNKDSAVQDKTIQKVSHDGRTDGLTLTGKAWEDLKIKNLPVRFHGFVGLVEANPHGEGEDLVTWGKRILDLCDERQIEYPKVFLKRIKGAERDQRDEDDPYGEVSRVAGPRGVPEELMR